MRAPHACTLCTRRCDCGEATSDDCAGCAMCHETEGVECVESYDDAEVDLMELRAYYDAESYGDR